MNNVEKEKYIDKRLEEHLDELKKDNYEIVYLAIQGSQNYDLDIYEEDYKSDIDTKAIVLPTFEDIVNDKQPISLTKVLDNGEHIDVKDIRLMFKTFSKQNINFIEILFSKYECVNHKYWEEMIQLLNLKEEIAHLNYNQALRCMAGMSFEKVKALQHPYPTIKDKIDKYGYDPKQLHHILRMNDFIKKYVKGLPYEQCLIPDNKEYLLDIKRGKLSCEEAIQLAMTTHMETHEIYTKNLREPEEFDSKTWDKMTQIKTDMIRKYFKEQLLSK